MEYGIYALICNLAVILPHHVTCGNLPRPSNFLLILYSNTRILKNSNAVCSHDIPQGFYQVEDKAPTRVPDYMSLMLENIALFDGKTNASVSPEHFLR